MDPLFGLPCVAESKAMDNARNRNQVAEKMLAQRVQSLAMAQKSLSGKIITTQSNIKDFRESLDLSNGKCALNSRRGLFEKRTVGSMSLREFDKIMDETKDRKKSTSSPPVPTPQPTSVKASNPNSFILKRESTFVLNTAFNEDTDHVVALDQYDRCLPINRQKHAMRGAWERATTNDIHHKTFRSQKIQSQQTQAKRKYSRAVSESPSINSSRSFDSRQIKPDHRRK